MAPKASDDMLGQATLLAFVDINGSTYSITPEQLAKMTRSHEDRNMLIKLADALRRRGTEQDGNWGHPAFNSEVMEVIKTLEAPK